MRNIRLHRIVHLIALGLVSLHGIGLFSYTLLNAETVDENKMVNPSTENNIVFVFLGVDIKKSVM